MFCYKVEILVYGYKIIERVNVDYVNIYLILIIIFILRERKRWLLNMNKNYSLE